MRPMAAPFLGNISSAIKLTSTVTWITSIETWYGRDAYPIGLIPVSMRSGGEESIRRIGMARTSQVLRQGSNASDAVLLVHRILVSLRHSPETYRLIKGRCCD
jgi:hypothetical protein